MKNTKNNRIKQVNNSLLFLKTTRKYENMRKIYLSRRRRKFILYIFSEYFLVIIVIVLKIQSS